MAKYVSEIDISRPDYLGGSVWKLRRLNEITVLFGKNGSGKSLLLRAFRDLDPDSRHYVCPERGGDIKFDPGYLTHEVLGPRRAEITKQNFSERYREQVVTRIQAYLQKRGSQREKQIRVSPEELESLLLPLLSDFTIRLTGSEPPYELSRNSGRAISHITELSSGETEVFTLGIDVLTISAIWELERREKRVLLIDEPDTHLHPDLQQRVADFIVRVSDTYRLQVVVATHSTTLLSALGQYGGKLTSVIYLTNATTTLDAIEFDSTQKELAACLGGHALMGPLFGAPLLLVEGDDDYRIWSQVPRHNVINVAVIPCNGDEIYRYQNRLEKIFSCLLDAKTTPSGYALLDGDKTLPNPSAENPQAHVRWVKLACRESENLYLTNEVLSNLGISWDEAWEKVKAESVNFGEKAEILASIDTWDRAQVDVKSVINEISKIIDKKNVVWTRRVGKCIGEHRPSGQIKDFLGESVVNALWGEEPRSGSADDY
jgi:energy-coupling factor transporter ATP-binding protein EcfA2